MTLRKITANPRRGEIAASIDGERRVLCLTLGALAELEATFGADDLSKLVDRFATGGLSARDIMRVVGAGLRGGGNLFTDDEVAQMTIDGGARGFAELVAQLLEATFGGGSAATANP
jgi:hypothetical protein